MYICYDIDDKWHNEKYKKKKNMKDEVKWCTIKIN